MNRTKARALMMIVLVGMVLLTTTIHLQLAAERMIELRHPLSVTASSSSRLSTERFLRVHTVAEPSPLKAISFGSSSTWGEGLETPQLAYPFQISSSVRNAASRGWDSATLAAACTQSIVGDENEAFDLITIEVVDINEGVEILARRLRQRFPAAAIIFIDLWSPRQLQYKSPSDGTVVSFETWRRSLPKSINGNAIPLHSSELTMQLLISGPANWSLSMEHRQNRLRRLISEVQGYMVALPVPKRDVFSYPKTLQWFFELFQDPTPYVLSAKGHAFVGEQIRALIKDESLMEQRQKLTVSRLGTWGSGDACSIWYSNGEFSAVLPTSSSPPRRIEFGHDKSLVGSHKHALEFRFQRHDSFRINNPFPQERMLYLTYMTSADDETYSTTRVVINGKASVAIDPYHEEQRKDGTGFVDFGQGSNNDYNRQYARTSAVGLVPPGESVVQLDPIRSSKLDFRLVGASFISDEVLDLPLDFSLEPDPIPSQSGFSIWG